MMPNAGKPLPDQPIPKIRNRTEQANAVNFDVRTAPYQLVGMGLAQIHGIGSSLALRMVAECGANLGKWRTAKHFTQWLTLSPGCKISGGKVFPAHPRKTTNRLAARIGKAKAVAATARKIAALLYNAMRFGIGHCDPGTDQYEQKYRGRVVE